jgi:hypothetical protein
METKKTKMPVWRFVLILGVVGVLAGASITAYAAAWDGPHFVPGESRALQQNETMLNFYRGHVVKSEYEQGYFVGSYPNFPELGVNPTIYPAPVYQIDTLYVLVPAWGCANDGGGLSCGLVNALAPAYNASFASQEQCAPATVEVCFDHPATIGVPNTLLGGGSGFTFVPLPGHDHLVASLDGHLNIWWQVLVVLVFNQNAWPGQMGPTGITSVQNMTAHPVVNSNGAVTESLTQALLDGDAYGPVVTNVFLDFLME